MSEENVARLGRKRLVLGFDAGCMSCSDLARRIEEQVGDRLEIRSLHDPQVEYWRKQALGEDAPWAPTLVEVNGGEVKAWTGLRMGLALSRKLGPIATWRVMQELGDNNESYNSDSSFTRVETRGFSRGQFLKGLGGAAVAMSVLSGTGVLSSKATAQELSTTSHGTPAQQRTIKALVRSSNQYERAVRRAGKEFDFEHARFVVDGAAKVGGVVLLTKVTNGQRAATATFFVDLQSNTVVFYNSLVRTKANNATKITRYENDKPLVHLTFENGRVTLPDNRKISIAQFEKEASEHEQAPHSTELPQGVVTTRSTCSRCCSYSYYFCQLLSATECLVAGVLLGGLAKYACKFIVAYSNSKSAGCKAFARVRCYNKYRCGCYRL